jgi:hypothetical protein
MKFWFAFFLAMLGQVFGHNLRVLVPLCDSMDNTTVSSYLESYGCEWNETICCYSTLEEDVEYVSNYVLENCSGEELSLTNFCGLDVDEGSSWWNPVKIFLFSIAGVVFAVAMYGECG